MKKQSYISIICISALSLIAASCSTENIDSPDNTQKPGDSNKEGYYINYYVLRVSWGESLVNNKETDMVYLMVETSGTDGQ